MLNAFHYKLYFDLLYGFAIELEAYRWLTISSSFTICLDNGFVDVINRRPFYTVITDVRFNAKQSKLSKF